MILPRQNQLRLCWSDLAPLPGVPPATVATTPPGRGAAGWTAPAVRIWTLICAGVDVGSYTDHCRRGFASGDWLRDDSDLRRMVHAVLCTSALVLSVGPPRHLRPGSRLSAGMVRIAGGGWAQHPMRGVVSAA